MKGHYNILKFNFISGVTTKRIYINWSEKILKIILRVSFKSVFFKVNFSLFLKFFFRRAYISKIELNLIIKLTND